jgi:uncharacterized protein YbjT (DUF2867 family)
MILLTGATGFIGSHTAKALREKGFAVRALVRPKANTQALKSLGIEIAVGDMGDPDSLSKACVGVEQIVHLVGIIRELPPKITFEKLHTEGTRNLLRATKSVGVKKFLYISAIGARSSAPARYHQTKWAAEEMVRSCGLEWTILRPSVVFGPGDEFINLLANDLVKVPPFIPVIGTGLNKLQPLWVKDLAEVICQSVPLGAFSQQVLEMGGSEQLTFREILEIIANHLKMQKPFINIPLALVKPAIAFGTAIAPQLLPLTSDQLTMLQEDNITSEKPFPKDFSLVPMTLAEGIKQYL